AIAALFTELPAGVFAAAAALLGVLAELFRAATAAPAGARQPVRGWSVRLGRSLRPSEGEPRWSVSPTTGALVAAAMPAALAVAALAPALTVALVTPYATLNRVWQGPPGDLASPPVGAVAGTDVAAALLLTVAGALAAVGLHNRRTVHAVPVVLPGVALTLLITPVSLDLPWPAGTLAALGVFTVAMLGLALTPPPRRISRTRPIRVNRVLVFGVGLAGGGAGMAGSLASPDLTLFTVGGAVVVGSVAALAGQTRRARVIGWIFAATMAHGFVLTTALYLDVPLAWSAFGVLAVGTALLLAGVALPRLRQEESPPETAVVEWIGHASALLALALVYDSPRHIAALLAAWGAVLGVASVRWQPMRSRILFWAAVGCEITAWWMMMYLADVTLPEAYTLPFAVLALIIGLLELRQRPDLNSWLAYGPALAAALLPTLIVVIAADTSNLRQVLLLLGAVAVLIFGSVRQQQAPVVIGAVVTAITALHALTLVGPWLVLLPVGLTLLLLGAGRERRQRAQDGLRALREMR
ncbi:MAG TPA: permease, partial [Micromonosporaceae bacterium]